MGHRRHDLLALGAVALLLFLWPQRQTAAMSSVAPAVRRRRRRKGTSAEQRAEQIHPSAPGLFCRADLGAFSQHCPILL